MTELITWRKYASMYQKHHGITFAQALQTAGPSYKEYKENFNKNSNLNQESKNDVKKQRTSKSVKMDDKVFGSKPDVSTCKVPRRGKSKPKKEVKQIFEDLPENKEEKGRKIKRVVYYEDDQEEDK